MFSPLNTQALLYWRKLGLQQAKCKVTWSMGGRARTPTQNTLREHLLL